MQAEKPIEHCGLCGVSGGTLPLDQVRLGLHSLQHRGQEAAGIMVHLRDKGCRIHKGLGLIDQAFANMPGWRNEEVTRTISHVRYGTAGGSSLLNAQPLMVNMNNQTIAIAHNGTICNAHSLRDELQKDGVLFQTTTDTEIILHLMARALKPCKNDLLAALKTALKRLQGAFSLLLATDNHMIAVRDPFGFRPLAIGDFDDGGYMVASETIAFCVTGATYIRDVDPGEIVVWDSSNRMKSYRYAKEERRAHCIFEHVYFARPGSFVFEDSVYRVRKEMGRVLAREAPVDADIIVPVPDSGIYAALGYAEESGIPLDLSLSRNHYVGRTFIDPELKKSRTKLVNQKLQPITEALRGKRVCLVDDSIVRGSTSRARIRTIRDVGALEVHMRISCPPHKHGCYFGIDFPKPEALFANKIAEEDRARALRLDSLAYLSKEGMLSCVQNRKPEDFCCACFDGDYPVIPDQIGGRL